MKVNLTGREIVNYLNGFLCIYKQRDVSLAVVKRRLMMKISSWVNSVDHPPVPTIERPIVVPHKKSKALVVVGMRKQLDYSQHPLVYGLTLRPEDVLLDEIEPMEATTSGICLFAVNDGGEKLEAVRDLSWINQYVINGVLGEQSKEHELHGQITVKAKYEHVTKQMFVKLLSRIRHRFRRLSYELANVDLHSERAFELAQAGAIRPKVLGTPIIYDIQLLQFEPPLFQLKILCVCEDDEFLRTLINTIGCSMDTVARPTRLQRIQVGPFLRTHALLDKYFQLPTIVKNIQMCNRIIDNHLNMERGDIIKSMDKGESLDFVDKYYLDSKNLQEELNNAIEEGFDEGDAFNLPFGRNYD